MKRVFNRDEAHPVSGSDRPASAAITPGSPSTGPIKRRLSRGGGYATTRKPTATLTSADVGGSKAGGRATTGTAHSSVTIPVKPPLKSSITPQGGRTPLKSSPQRGGTPLKSSISPQGGGTPLKSCVTPQRGGTVHRSSSKVGAGSTPLTIKIDPAPSMGRTLNSRETLKKQGSLGEITATFDQISAMATT